MTELAFIENLKSTLLAQNPTCRALPIPPGDDCALVASSAKGVLFAADMLMEGVHFDLSKTTPELVGRKALAVNLSDIAAMAGTPTAVTVTLALPRSYGSALGDGIMQGMIALANEYRVAIAGGDTNSWRGPLVVSVAVIGDPHPRGSVQRNGAQPGDWIMVTGSLGGSIHSRHLTFSPRVVEAQVLHRTFGLTSMIDLSDGLATDLRHIANESRVGARLERSRIPIHPDCQRNHDTADDRVHHALRDGEDFELLFTVPPSTGKAMLDARPFGDQLQLSHIGQITEPNSGIVWDDNAPLVVTGYTHEFT